MNGLTYSIEQSPFGAAVTYLDRSTTSKPYVGTDSSLHRLQQASCPVIGQTKSARTLRGYGLNGPGFEYRYEQEIVLFSTTSTPTLGPTHTQHTHTHTHIDSYLMCTGGASPGGTTAEKWSWPLPPSRAVVRNECSYVFIPPLCLHGVHRNTIRSTFC
jgi:hypothetical protein